MSSGGGGIIVGPGGSGFGGAGLETAFGGGGSMPHQGATAATGHTSELEDPPGLYEKVIIRIQYACYCTCMPTGKISGTFRWICLKGKHVIHGICLTP